MAYKANHSKEVTAAALRMIKDGTEDETIATRLGVSIQTVHGWKSWRSRMAAKARIASETATPKKTAQQHLAEKIMNSAKIAEAMQAGLASEYPRDLSEEERMKRARNEKSAKDLHAQNAAGNGATRLAGRNSPDVFTCGYSGDVKISSGEITNILIEIDDQLEGAFRNVATLGERIQPVLSKNLAGTALLQEKEKNLSDLGAHLYGFFERLRHLNGQLEGLHNSIAL